MAHRTPKDEHDIKEDLEPVAEESKPAKPLASIGAQLKKAREEKGLQIDAVASQMRLGVSMVQDIERNQFKDLPGTFIRGYVRGYAKLVGLDGDELIKQYDASHEDSPRDIFYRSHIEKEQQAQRQQVGRRFAFNTPKLNLEKFHIMQWLKSRYIIYVGVVIVVILIALMWSHHHSEAKSADVVNMEAAAPAPAATDANGQPMAATEAQTTVPAEADKTSAAAEPAKPAQNTPHNSELTSKLNMDT